MLEFEDLAADERMELDLHTIKQQSEGDTTRANEYEAEGRITPIHPVAIRKEISNLHEQSRPTEVPCPVYTM